MEQRRKVEIGEHGRINVKWNVLPIDYSNEKLDEIKARFSKKYGIPKNHITIEPVPIQRTESGETTVLSDGIIQNIHDPLVQQDLMKQYLDYYQIENYDFKSIIDIDNIINAKIDYDLYKNHKRYTLKWLKWSNFMSYGKDNFFDFTKVDGLTLLTSNPANQGGKSTFCLDLFRFLLFGKVTSRENDWTLAKVFNRFLKNETECSVEGCVEIDGVDYVIKRTVTRPKLERRTENSKVTHKLNYYKLVNEEYVELEDEENQNEAGNRQTSKLIKEAIGNEADFDLMICVNSDNLKKLISLKDTERGRLIARWIGLMPLEEKDQIAREMFNKQIMPQSMTSRYNKAELTTKIEELTEENKKSDKELKQTEPKVAEQEKRISDLRVTRDTILQSKIQIDESLMKIDVNTLQETINDITERGKKKRAEKEENEKRLLELSNITFNEDDYKQLETECTLLSVSLATMREQLKTFKLQVEALEKGEFCPTCGAKLKNVDNSKAIQEKKDEIEKLIEDGKTKAVELKEKQALKEKLAVVRQEFNEKIKLQLVIDKISVDIKNLTSEYREAMRLMKDIESNKTAIENNAKMMVALNNIDANIKTEENTLRFIQNTINDIKNAITYNNKLIDTSNEILKLLKNEEVTIRSWKLYLEMVGKNGITKFVMRTALPFINAELKRLLTDVCDFDVEIGINDKNDVEFTLIHDNERAGLGSGSGFEQTAASIALRSVLGKISTFSKPSFIVFDEVLGGVAEENYDKMKLLYDKITKDYKVLFQISHLAGIVEWHKHFVVVSKKENISKIVIE